MDVQKIKKLILILYLGVFPLGQIPALLATFINPPLHIIHITDILVFLYVILAYCTDITLTKFLLKSYLLKFVCIVALSLFFSFIFLHLISPTSLLYFVRFAVYLLFGFALWYEKPLSKNEVVVFVLLSGLFIAVVGLIQYFFIPDTRPLQILGWDDHYFRLIGNFLDPGFTGIILVLNIIFLSFKYNAKKTQKLLVLGVIFLSLLFTYSRSSYLSLVLSFLTFVVLSKRGSLKLLLFIPLFFVLLFILPRPSSEGVKLERTYSIGLRLNNFKETLFIWMKSPVFGIGYNNLCEVKKISFNDKSAISHSCSGADDSLLLLLATTGILGVGYLFYILFLFLQKFGNTELYVLFVAIFVHSQFSNTLFYPWIMGWVAVVLPFVVFRKKH